MKTGFHGLVTALFLGMAMPALGGERDYLGWAGVTEAHATTKGEGVTIALLNTGVNYHLPEFRDRIAKDESGNFGFDAVTGTFDPMDLLEYGLGTQVASIVAGNVHGVAPEARVIPVRVFDEYGAGTLEVLAKGVSYAVERGADIIEIGGGPLHLERATALCDAIKQAEARDILVILPVGNDGSPVREYPTGCRVENALVVAALDKKADLAPYSSFGFPAVHIAAPAEGIWRISRDGAILKDGQGTSFSAAFASGVAALVKSAHPEYTAVQVKTAMIRGAIEKDSLRGKVLANGYLHAAKAVHAGTGRPD